MIGDGDDNGNKISIGNGCIYYGMSTLGNTSSDGFYVGTKGIALGKGAFKVTDKGELTATSGTFSGSLNGATGSFTGTITATGGYIGETGNGKTPIQLGDGFIKYGKTSVNDTASGFYISSAGIGASNVNLTGTINATDGTIGSGNSKIQIGAGSIYYNMTNGLSDTSHDGFYIGTNGISLGKGAFKVTDAGVLTATNGNFTGTINATEGTIGGTDKIQIGNGCIYYNRSTFSSTSTADGFYIGTNGITLGKNFTVTDTGNVTLTGTVTASSGTIGNFTIGSDGSLYTPSNRGNYNNHNIVGLTLEKNGFLGMKSSNGFVDMYDGVVFCGKTVSTKSYGAALLGDVVGSDSSSPSGTTGLSLWNSTSGVVCSISALNGNIVSSGTLSIYGSITVHSNFSSQDIFEFKSEGSMFSNGGVIVDKDGYLYDRSGSNRYKLSSLYAPISPGSSIRFKDVSRTLLSKDIESFYSVKPVLAKYKQTHLSEDHYWQGVEMPMLIAEDIEKVYPGAVMYDNEGNINDYSDHLVVSVHQQMLIDQKAEIESLKAEISKLKKLIERM